MISNRDKNFIFGVRFLILAGLFPTIVGSIYFYRAFDELLEMYYRALILHQLPDNKVIHLIPTHIGAINLMLSGITLITVAHFGIREKFKWAYYLNFFIYVWMGFHDFLGTYLLYKIGMMPIPTPIFPLFFGGLGFLLTHKSIFEPKIDIK